MYPFIQKTYVHLCFLCVYVVKTLWILPLLFSLLFAPRFFPIMRYIISLKLLLFSLAAIQVILILCPMLILIKLNILLWVLLTGISHIRFS